MKKILSKHSVVVILITACVLKIVYVAIAALKQDAVHKANRIPLVIAIRGIFTALDYLEWLQLSSCWQERKFSIWPIATITTPITVRVFSPISPR